MQKNRRYKSEKNDYKSTNKNFKEDKKLLIKIKDLKKSFNKTEVLKGLNLEIYENDFTVIMGSSGAGKSTLLYQISGIDSPDSGSIDFAGCDIAKLNSDEAARFRRKHCGFVFQQIYLIEDLSLIDNVLLAGALSKKSKQEIIAKAESLFELFNISSKVYNTPAKKVSGGEAQRAGIVRSVINDAEIIFADEPTGALNSANSKLVLDLLCELNRRGQSIVMVTHDRKSALRADRIIYLKDGLVSAELRLGKYLKDDAERIARFERFISEEGW